MLIFLLFCLCLPSTRVLCLQGQLARCVRHFLLAAPPNRPTLNPHSAGSALVLALASTNITHYITAPPSTLPTRCSCRHSPALCPGPAAVLAHLSGACVYSTSLPTSLPPPATHRHRPPTASAAGSDGPLSATPLPLEFASLKFKTYLLQDLQRAKAYPQSQDQLR